MADNTTPHQEVPPEPPAPEHLAFCAHKFIIEEPIGEGSFSSVYRAICKTTGEAVAIKAITKTTAPRRIHQELNILKALGGENNCAKLLDVMRENDQIIAVFPLIEHVDFKDLILKGVHEDIRKYMRSLLVAIRHMHDKNIIHRDIKPGNFLYNIEREQGCLIDFGLAEYETIREAPPQKVAKPVIFFNSIITPSKPPGYYERDSRPPMKAPRAGTRGFRAPEVLFRCENQTKAIDIWSVGVIMLCLLTGQYPFFFSPDDVDGLVEMAMIFGNSEMRKIARFYGRVWRTNLASIPEVGMPFDQLIKKFNPNMHIDDNTVGLLTKLLDLNCERRITARDALRHPFFLNRPWPQ